MVLYLKNVFLEGKLDGNPTTEESSVIQKEADYSKFLEHIYE
jgi:hypothetical protein